MSDNEEPPALVDLDDRARNDGEAGPSTYQERRKVPLTLLTGYLGAGKSTLLQYVLTADHGYKIAVCMNDFGDTTDIEAKQLTLTDPVTGEQTSSFLSLPNGCLCCSFKDMGIAAIEEMVAQQDCDWVMVELTGIADPSAIARDFWANEEMGDLLLDGIVCVVDCRNVLNQLGEQRDDGDPNEAQKQVASADVILLNKTDLVDRDRIASVAQTIHELNPTLRVHQTVQSRIPLSQIFNLRAYTSHQATLDSLAQGDRSEHKHDTQSAGAHDHDHGHTDGQHPKDPKTGTKHSSALSTTLVPLPALSDEQHLKLNSFLESVLWENKLPRGAASASDAPTPDSALHVVRTKGYIVLADGREFALQGVTDIFEMSELNTDGAERGGQDASTVSGKVVFIGRGLEGVKQSLQRYLGLD